MERKLLEKQKNGTKRRNNRVLRKWLCKIVCNLQKKCSKYESQRWRVSKEIMNLNWSHVFFIPHLILLLWFYKFNTFSTIFLLPLLEGKIFSLFWVKMRFSFVFLSFSYSLFYPLTYEYFLHVYFSCFAKQ